MYSDAQKQLYFNQRELLSASIRGSSAGQAGKPVSPRLEPLGSPGPVTPLELEREEGYLLAGARNSAKDARPAEELLENLVRQETMLQRSAAASQQQQRTGR